LKLWSGIIQFIIRINSIPVQLLTSRSDSNSIQNSFQKSTQFHIYST